MADSVLGIVANPQAGRDVRRLVARASVFPNAEKAAMVQRLLAAAGSLGVARALLSTDLAGISASVLRSRQRRIPAQDGPWPDTEFLDHLRLTGTAADTEHAVADMVGAGARVIICLGGDGTARAAARACADVPLLALSTGTNNTFPEMREATVAGLAAALLATGAVDADTVTRRATALHITADDHADLALVDVAVCRTRHVGSRAVWDPSTVTDVLCTVAEPDAIGLSSVAGLVHPSPRSTPNGVAVRLCPPHTGATTVRAAIGPGLIRPVGVAEARTLTVGETVPITTSRGVLALDGERDIEFGPASRPTVTLAETGPRRPDITAVMRRARDEGLLLVDPPTPQGAAP